MSFFQLTLLSEIKRPVAHHGFPESLQDALVRREAARGVGP